MQSLPRDNCFQAYKKCLQKYATFSGRSRRSEYWYFKLLYYLIFIIIAISIVFFFIDEDENELIKIMNTVYLIYSLLFLIPNISVTVRRIHDTGRSGYFFFMYFIPIIGPFFILYYCICDSQEQTNEYGPSPKYIELKGSFLGNQNNNNYLFNNLPNTTGNNNTFYTPVQLNEYSNSGE